MSSPKVELQNDNQVRTTKLSHENRNDAPIRYVLAWWSFDESFETMNVKCINFRMSSRLYAY